MKLYYDLHIHSALSPCGDKDMTPNNIVNMSIIKGLDIIAVADHNSCGNVRAVMQVAGDRLLVIPAMEVETSEEVHMVCYFPSIEACEKMDIFLKEHMSGVKNQEKIFGEQLYMDSEDNIIGKEENLLVTATDLDIFQVSKKTKEFGGVAVPAHIDRSSYSILSNLGFIPPELVVDTVEITAKNRLKMEREYGEKYNVISNSDAHYLEDIAEPEFYINIMSKSAEKVIEYLCKR